MGWPMVPKPMKPMLHGGYSARAHLFQQLQGGDRIVLAHAAADDGVEDLRRGRRRGQHEAHACASSMTMRRSFWCIQALKPGLKLRSSMRWPWFSRIFE
jgi:hypothetical protein